MIVGGLETLLDGAYPYPELVGDQLSNLHARPCTMIPLTERAFPEQMEAFHAEYSPDRILDHHDSATEANEQLLDRVDDVEAAIANRLWSAILDPALSGFSTEIVATPYRDTHFESAVHADYTPRWKIEAYLFAPETTPSKLATIRSARERALESLREGKYPTGTTKEHALTEIRAKSEVFGYPSCCTKQFLEERERRFDVLLEIGADRIQELRRESRDRRHLQSAFEAELEERGLPLEDLNVESRIVQQLEYMNIGKYFDDWTYEQLSEFYREKSREPLPSFFYAFFTRDFYPHDPRCDAAVEIGQAIESKLEEVNPALVPVYRASLMTNVFSCLGFDDHQLHRRLLSDTIETADR